MTARVLADVVPVLQEVDAASRAGKHAVGFVSYEAAPAFDVAFTSRAPQVDRGELPLAWFGVFDTHEVVRAGETSPAAHAGWRERIGRTEFDRAIAAIRDAIGRGDVYQVNFTALLDVDVRGDHGALYHRLLAAQGPGYGARIHTGRHEILSASPELFFDRRGAHITAKPMKGTARRGRWSTEDESRALALASSPKERAENVMIVDLLRNDLGRVAVAGTVAVPALFDVERRPTVLQMTSTVTATLRNDVRLADLFTALFPCGSVTGAPKVAATQMIAALESAPRGVYCGAIGHVAPGGDATFSVAIRTLVIDHERRTAVYGVGSGITWDSAPELEYDEVVAKAGILTHDLPQFDLIETLRLEHGRYARLDRHLTRLEASADYFGFTPAKALRVGATEALLAHAQRAGSVSQRVRVRVAPDGRAVIDYESLPTPSAMPVRVALASSPVRETNRFLYHKTTHRAVYDRHRAEHAGAFDVLLWNEAGNLTEFTIGNVVLELDGTRATPPRACGLLAGVFREELLDHGVITERTLTRDDVHRATRMWLINSVREWVEVRCD
ncbi:MAG TPA: aminodeoxychorismate synthase component I [Gemmatimonadaceae bacterium]|nr:aminodeoxychorismate synthase component I [Gemmatimonadaceae bacterium]